MSDHKVILPKDTVLIGRSALALMMNALQRDADNGHQARKEILEMVENDIDHWDSYTADPPTT